MVCYERGLLRLFFYDIGATLRIGRRCLPYSGFFMVPLNLKAQFTPPFSPVGLSSLSRSRITPLPSTTHQCLVAKVFPSIPSSPLFVVEDREKNLVLPCTKNITKNRGRVLGSINYPTWWKEWWELCILWIKYLGFTHNTHQTIHAIVVLLHPPTLTVHFSLWRMKNLCYVQFV